MSRLAALAITLLFLAAAPGASADPVFHPDPLVFDDRLVATSSEPLDVVVTNDSADPYDVTDVFLDGPDSADFEIVTDGCTGVELTRVDDTHFNSCTVSIRFKPTAAGDRGAVLVLDNGSSEVFGVLIGGFAYDPPTIDVAPAALAFPATRHGTSPSPLASVDFFNDGDGPATFTTASVTGTDAAAFRVGTDECSGQTIAPTGWCTVWISFVPQRLGQHSATLVLASDGAGAPHSVPLSGEGLLDADLRLEPPALDFGLMTPPFSTIVREVVVHNVGDSTARVTPRIRASRVVGGPLIATNTCSGHQLKPGGSCRVGVQFRPMQTFRLTGELYILGNVSRLTLASGPLSGEVRGPELTVTTAMLKSPLVDAARKWRTARRPALGRRGFRAKVKLPLSGRLVLRVFGAAARSSTASRRLIARGGVTVYAQEEAEVAARLTRVGRLLLRKRRPLELRAELKFRAGDGRGWATSRRLRLPR